MAPIRTNVYVDGLPLCALCVLCGETSLLTNPQSLRIIAPMYETYVPTDTIVERKPPTIADIVREKTDDGARIVEFFLGLMEGYVADAQLCHRIDAAKQLVKYGSKEAADFIAEHGDETCDHCESRKRGPRSRKDASPAAGPPYAAPHLTPDFLTLLTEDFFTVLTAVDEDLMIQLVRGQTRYGDSIVEFLDSVMQGREDGFKPHHRIAAAKELISHIIRDEHRSHTSAIPARKIVVPAKAEPALSPSKGRYGGEGDSPDTTTTTVAPTHTTVVPAKAEPAPYSIRGTQRSGGPGTALPSRAGVRPEPTTTVVLAHPVVVPAEAGTHLRPNGTVAIAEGPAPEQTGAHTQTPNPEPVLSNVEGPVLSFTEEPVLSAAEEPQPGPKDSKPETLPRRRTRTQRRREGNARAAMRKKAQESRRNRKDDEQDGRPRKRSRMRLITGPSDEEPKTYPHLTPTERRIRERLKDYWNDPNPYGAPIDSTTPGRSPPR